MSRDVHTTVDAVVIGGGVVGCAVARSLARRGLVVYVLEALPSEGHGLTSRNSGVVHSGIYYTPDSMKARTCIRGQELLWDWVSRKGVPHRKTGKLVVARESRDSGALQGLYENAQASGARDVSLLSSRELTSLEPDLPPMHGALRCPHTGIVDPVALTRSLRRDAEDEGAMVLFGARVTGLEWLPGEPFLVKSTRGDVRAHRLINAGGLDADRIAELLDGEAPNHHPCRGDYFRLRGQRSFRHLIYPIRRPGDPGLGIHLTLDLEGGVRLGPDSEWVETRDHRGSREDKRIRFLVAAETLIGPIRPEDLVWDGCGIRPKLRAPDEDEDRDFLVREGPTDCLHLLGIESPGLTAAMALAEVVAGRLDL